MSQEAHITWREQLTGMLFALPYIVGLAVFLVVPLGMALYYSFTDYPLVNPHIKALWIGSENYTRLFHDARFWQVLGNTALYSFCSVPFSLAVALTLALMLNEAVPFRALYRTIVFLPSLIPGVASAMIWLWVLNPTQGLLNHVLDAPLAWISAACNWVLGVLHVGGHVALHPPDWLGNPHLAMPALIVLSAWGVGNTVVIFLAGLQDVPTELYEAAEIDGAGRWGRFRHVTLPMLSPVIFFNLVMGVIGSWQFFETPYILTGGGPDHATESYSMYLFDNAMRYTKMGYASAMAWVQFVIIVGMTGLVVWSGKKWVHYR